MLRQAFSPPLNPNLLILFAPISSLSDLYWTFKERLEKWEDGSPPAEQLMGRRGGGGGGGDILGNC